MEKGKLINFSNKLYKKKSGKFILVRQCKGTRLSHTQSFVGEYRNRKSVAGAGNSSSGQKWAGVKPTRLAHNGLEGKHGNRKLGSNCVELASKVLIRVTKLFFFKILNFKYLTF